VDRVKPERNLGAAKPSVGERRDEHPARKGFHHGTAVYGPVCTVVWEGRSREASPYPDRKNLWFAERNENPGRCFRESRRHPRAQSKLLIQEQLPKARGGKGCAVIDRADAVLYD
jgi:hypothetical protein